MGKLFNINRLAYFLLSNITLALIFELCIILPSTNASKLSAQDTIEDNEFAEFEDIEDDSEEFTSQIKPTPSPPSQNEQQANSKVDENDGIVEDDEDEFETVRDDDDQPQDKINLNEPSKNNDLKITKIPLHLRANWESYYLEFLLIFGLFLYFIIFVNGRAKNFNIANSWYEQNLEVLEYNFSLVGDDGKKEIENQGLIKETENIYSLWCSGRNSIEAMQIEMHLLKRQDLFSIIVNYFKPSNDKLIVKTSLNADVLDNFVFCIANRKSAIRLSKEMNDIVTFCPERKLPEKYGITSENMVLFNEIGEAASFILDAKVISLLNKYEDLIEYIHISDQYSGVRNTDETQITNLPEVKKILIASFNLSNNTKSEEETDRMKPLIQMLFYLVDKLKRFRLSRESKVKSDRNRQKMQKLFLQSTHLQRQELAQAKREEKRRVEKERMLQESDPEKQRRWEEKEYKREMKRKVPKMKQLKVKAM